MSGHVVSGPPPQYSHRQYSREVLLDLSHSWVLIGQLPMRPSLAIHPLGVGPAVANSEHPGHPYHHESQARPVTTAQPLRRGQDFDSCAE